MQNDKGEAPAGDGMKTIEEWGALKGGIDKVPHQCTKAFYGWKQGKRMFEADYDKAVKTAYEGAHYSGASKVLVDDEVQPTTVDAHKGEAV
jgi:hypothetical protein